VHFDQEKRKSEEATATPHSEKATLQELVDKSFQIKKSSETSSWH